MRRSEGSEGSEGRRLSAAAGGRGGGWREKEQRMNGGKRIGRSELDQQWSRMNACTPPTESDSEIENSL